MNGKRKTKKTKEEYSINQIFFEPYSEELKYLNALTIYCDEEDYLKQ